MLDIKIKGFAGSIPAALRDSRYCFTYMKGDMAMGAWEVRDRKTIGKAGYIEL